MDFITNLYRQGGVFMVPLLLASCVAVAIILERFIWFSRLQNGNDGFRARLRTFLREGKVDEARQWLATRRGPAPVTALAALDAWSEDAAAVEASMATRARLEVPRIRRYLPILDTTYSAAPLVGLLGTITGMMGTFQVVAQHLARDPHADTSGVTAGIGEALITTATGICVAVVCLIFNNAFQTWGDHHLDSAEVVAADMLEMHEEFHAARGAAR